MKSILLETLIAYSSFHLLISDSYPKIQTNKRRRTSGARQQHSWNRTEKGEGKKERKLSSKYGDWRSRIAAGGEHREHTWAGDSQVGVRWRQRRCWQNHMQFDSFDPSRKRSTFGVNHFYWPGSQSQRCVSAAIHQNTYSSQWLLQSVCDGKSFALSVDSFLNCAI